MKQIRTKILEFNLPDEYKGVERMRMKLINVYAFISLFITLSYMIYWAIDGRLLHLYSNAILFLFPVAAMTLIHFKQIKTARLIILYAFPFFGFNFTAYLYGNLGIENYFVALLVMFVFGEDDRRKNILYGVFIAICLFGNKFIYTHFDPIDADFKIVGEQFYYVNLLMSSIAIIFFLLEFKNEIRIKDRKITNVLKELEDQYHQEIRHKEFILELSGELNHRVKNNLQIVSSLIRMDASRCETQEAVESLNNVQRKILNLSVLHKHLHQTDKVMYVDILSYLKELMDQVQISLGVYIKVNIEITPKEFKLDSGIASNIGLVLNELLVNTIKHNPNSSNLQVDLKIERETSNNLFILFRDNGVGFKDVDHLSDSSFGLGFIKSFCSYNGGDMHIYNQNGANIEIRIDGGEH